MGRKEEMFDVTGVKSGPGVGSGVGRIVGAGAGTGVGNRVGKGMGTFVEG